MGVVERRRREERDGVGSALVESDEEGVSTEGEDHGGDVAGWDVRGGGCDGGVAEGRSVDEHHLIGRGIREEDVTAAIGDGDDGVSALDGLREEGRDGRG